MIAIVVKIEAEQHNRVTVRVRRNMYTETLWGQHTDLHVGDRVEVSRQANNPYLLRKKS